MFKVTNMILISYFPLKNIWGREARTHASTINFSYIWVVRM